MHIYVPYRKRVKLNQEHRPVHSALPCTAVCLQYYSENHVKCFFDLVLYYQAHPTGRASQQSSLTRMYLQLYQSPALF
jgi:hypothetical protein